MESHRTQVISHESLAQKLDIMHAGPDQDSFQAIYPNHEILNHHMFFEGGYIARSHLFTGLDNWVAELLIMPDLMFRRSYGVQPVSSRMHHLSAQEGDLSMPMLAHCPFP